MAEKKQSENVLDILAKGATSFVKAKTAQDKSQLEMKSKLALKKIESSMVTPYQQIMGQIAQKQYPGVDMSAVTGQQYASPAGGAPGGPGAPGGTPGGGVSRLQPEFGAKGISLKMRGFKDIVEQIYQKPQDQWSARERGMVAQYHKMQEAGRAEKAPSWKQGQEVEAIKAGLKQGKLTLFSVQGIPIPQDVKTREQAIQAISGKGYDPEMFKEELDTYYPEEMTLPEGITQEQVQKARDAGWNDEEITTYFKGK